MMTKMKLQVAITAIVCMGLIACNAASIISLIEGALTIALEAASVTGVIPPQFQQYVDASLSGIECASQEAATMDSAQIKSAKIAACLSGIAAPVLPAGTAQNIVNLVNKLSNAIAKLLGGLPPQGLAEKRGQVKDLTVSDSQKNKLLSMAKQAHDARVKLHSK